MARPIGHPIRGSAFPDNGLREVPRGMKILVIGKGGREHALAWKLAQSPRADTVFVAPGNAGTAREFVNVPFDYREPEKLVRFAKSEQIGLTVVGPEDLLA